MAQKELLPWGVPDSVSHANDTKTVRCRYSELEEVSGVQAQAGCLLRLPQNPVMNSPVVSVAVFHRRNFLRGVLESPISLEFRLLQTANRSKAICVQWDPPGP